MGNPMPVPQAEQIFTEFFTTKPHRADPVEGLILGSGQVISSGLRRKTFLLVVPNLLADAVLGCRFYRP